MHKRCTIEEHKHWSDTDYTGMMYNGQFLRLCEIAETELFRAVGLPYAEVSTIWTSGFHVSRSMSISTSRSCLMT